MVVSALLLSACGSSGEPEALADTDPAEDDASTEQPADDWDEIVQAAEDEGEVTFYISAPGIFDRVQAIFEEKYDISMIEVRDATGVLLPRLEAEKDAQADGADVVLLADDVWCAANSDELLAPAGPANELWESDAPDYHHGDWLTGLLNPSVIAYNTDLVTDPPQDYADLVDAAYANQIGSVDLVSDTMHGFYDFIRTEHGEDVLETIAAQNVTMFGSTVPLAQSIGAGELAIGLYQVPGAVAAAAAEGAPIDLVLPEPTLSVPYCIAATGWSHRPNAAMVLMDFLMSEEGQEAIHAGDDAYGGPIDVPGALDPNEMVIYDSSEWPDERKDEFEAYWNDLFR